MPGSEASEERSEGLRARKAAGSPEAAGRGASRPGSGAGPLPAPPGGREGAPRNGPGGTVVALWAEMLAGDSLRRWEDESALAGFRRPQSPSLPPRRHPGVLTELTLGSGRAPGRRPVCVPRLLGPVPLGPHFRPLFRGPRLCPEPGLGLPSASRAGLALNGLMNWI